jgi:hypothetical protein
LTVWPADGGSFQLSLPLLIRFYNIQVFLPYPDYYQSVYTLDKKRLFKQLVEAKQLIDGLRGLGSLSWTKHPASKMYVGYTDSLVEYHNICYHRCVAEGFKLVKSKLIEYGSKPINPIWLGYPPLHCAMRANLMKKDVVHYSQLNWPETGMDAHGYIWPVDKQGNVIREILEWAQYSKILV